MAGYLNLPNEIKDLIDLSQKDLSRLSRTSKRIRKAVLPQLYKRMTLSWEAFQPPPHVWSAFQAIQSPELAELVEELQLCGNGYREDVPNPERQGRKTLSRKEVPEYLFEAKPKLHRTTAGSGLAMKRALGCLGFKEDDWKPSTMSGGEEELDFVIAAIIVRCPNLKLLSLGAAFIHANTFLPKVLHHFIVLKNNPSALTKLEKVCLAQDLPPYSNTRVRPLEFPLSSYLPFLCLPSLRAFSAPLPDQFCDLLEPRNIWPTISPPSCAVHTLDLHMTRATPATLSLLMANLPILRVLKYKYWCRAGQRLDCTELRNALSGSRLTELVISVEPYTTAAEEIDEMGPWTVDAQGLGSLAFMPSLTKLEMSLPILLDWRGGSYLKDTLPPNLEELCLGDEFIHYSGMFWDEEMTVKEVRRWLKASKSCTPHIKKFGLRLSHSQMDEWGAQPRNALMNMCDRKGLEFWFEKSSPDYELSNGRYEKTDNSLRYPLPRSPYIP